MDRKTNKRELITPEMKSNTICLEIRIPPEGKHFPQFEKKEIASWEIKLDKTSSKQRSFSIKIQVCKILFKKKMYRKTS